MPVDVDVPEQREEAVDEVVVEDIEDMEDRDDIDEIDVWREREY